MREECVQARYILPRFCLWNSYDTAYNCRKREEESKRKEAKLQKAVQNVEEKFRAQQSPANQDKITSISQLPTKLIDAQNKRPPSLNATQTEPGRNSRGSPKACHNKGAPKESAEPQSEGHKIKQGL